MDFLRRLRSTLSISTSSAPPLTASVVELIQAFEQDVAKDPQYAYVDRHPAAQAMLARAAVDGPELVAAMLQRMLEVEQEPAAAQPGHRQPNVWDFCRLVNRLLGEPLPFTQARLAQVLDFCAWNIARLQHRVRFEDLIQQIKPFAAGGMSDEGPLARAIADFTMALRSTGASGVRLSNDVERLLASKGTKRPALVSSAWSEQVKALATTDEDHRAIAHALSAASKSKPSAAFLKAARAMMTQTPDLAERAMTWIEAYVPDPQAVDPNEDAIRGLIWMLSTADPPTVAARLGRYCELCFKKIPNIGARSVKLGNGVIQTLAALGTAHAIAELTRLKTRVRYPLVVRRIEATLAALASELNVSEEELEEMALPTYDLSADGERRLPVGDGSAILRISGTREVALSFAGANGREVASPPKALKDAAPEAIASARKLRKEIEATLAGQSARIERLYLSDRAIPHELWRQRYLHQPLLTALTQRLVWLFRWGERAVPGLPRGDIIEDVDGKPLAPEASATVTLWHPLMASADQVLAWRRRLASLGITQPFKQAHREIYLLTDAERQTETYSNRFAAHLLRQHQFKALCDQRGWRFHLMGRWDSHNTPTRLLAARGLAVEFWVNGVEDTETAHAVYTLIATDQVRFLEIGGDVRTLASIPQLLFSELMRDVDLFVGVASVGNDPNWFDGGPRGFHQAYWNSYAFGELGPSAKTRAEVLAALLPGLVIADRCELSDRFLLVRGKRRSYKIHLGSANIQMAPNDQYLCIVPGRGLSDKSKPLERLVLPFEGDTTLSVILSKAFMLANDDKIADPSILSQIERG